MAEEFSVDGMVDMYLYENGQLMEKLEEILLETKDDDAFDENSINEIFRIMHTIKGSSGIMMYDNIMKVSHKLEEMEKIKDGNDPDGDNSDLITMMNAFLDNIKGGGSAAPEQPKPKVEEKKSEEKLVLKPNQFYIAPQASGDEKCFRIRITYHSDTQMCNLRAYSATYALKEYTEDMHYTPEDILVSEEASKKILEDGFLILVRGNFTEQKLHDLIDTTSEIESIDIMEVFRMHQFRQVQWRKNIHRKHLLHQNHSQAIMLYIRRLAKQNRLQRRRRKKSISSRL